MSALNFGTTMGRFRHAFPVLFALAAMALPSGSSAQMVDVTVAIAPPELPVYDQPEIPCPFRKLYPAVLVVQSSQDRNGEDGARTLDCSMQGCIFL